MNSRRAFLGTAVGVVGLGTLKPIEAQTEIRRVGGPQVKISLNAYSFNRPLRDGTMTLDELLEFSAEVGFKAVDLTAYYFPNYPEPPDDEYLYRIKKRAYLLGLDISGTGVRTNFTTADEMKRAADLEHVNKWVKVASKLGAPSLRIFAGQDATNREQATAWLVDSIRECTQMGRRYGVMMVLQNHFNFIKTPEQLLEIIRQVDSEWLAVHLDIGSFGSDNPYREIAEVAPYAATWQVKESVYFGERETKTDLTRIVSILDQVGFRGYVLLETLGEGDPKRKVRRFLQELETALNKI